MNMAGTERAACPTHQKIMLLAGDETKKGARHVRRRPLFRREELGVDDNRPLHEGVIFAVVGVCPGLRERVAHRLIRFEIHVDFRVLVKCHVVFRIRCVRPGDRGADLNLHRLRTE